MMIFSLLSVLSNAVSARSHFCHAPSNCYSAPAIGLEVAKYMIINRKTGKKGSNLYKYKFG